MYLSGSHILLDRIIAVLQIIGMGFLTFIGAYGFISDILDPASNSQDIAGSLGIFIASALLLLRGISTLRTIGKANKFNVLFCGDHDGAIKASVIASHFGMSEEACIRLFDKLVQRGYLINCRAELADTPVISLREGSSGSPCLVKFKANLVTAVSIAIAGFSEFILYMCVYSFVTAIDGDPDARTSVSIWVGLGVTCGFLLWLAFALRRQAGLAYRFSSMFTGDANGIISIDKAAAALYTNADTLARQFNSLVEKGYLHNCHLELSPERRIILSNGAAKALDRFVAVTCPNCGASNSFKAGFIGNCKFCDTKIEV